ncbi:MAG: family 16 glycosylhydrolase [Gemmatimonadetes bacterium]|nr:family 16 glycosylhydrolase [Gemmatimonadota bacterium]
MPGLVVWLDASHAPSLQVDTQQRLTHWRNRVGDHHHARAGSPDSAPRFEASAIDGRPAIYFREGSRMQLDALDGERGGVTLFAVFHRAAADTSDERWQRVLSCWNGVTPNDTQSPSFFLDTGGIGGLQPPTILSVMASGVDFGPMTLGMNQAKGDEDLRGNLAELLIYDRAFLVYEQFDDVRSYLRAKWELTAADEGDWTRVGPLPNSPARQTNHLPLSDQANVGDWQPLIRLWDEFETSRLDTSKWWDHHPNWYGRAPARFLPRNVAVEAGQLRLRMRHEPDLPQEVLYENGESYHSFSSASVVSKQFVRYGYYEIQARPMASAGSSAWWFSASVHDTNGATHRTEIDVFELGGRAPGHESLYHMNTHIFDVPATGKKHFSRGGQWKAPYRFVDADHVFGLHWTDEFLEYYVDGVLVRRQPNEYWHAPVKMIFDSETMGNWLGMPEVTDLPSTFSVEYVRAWTNASTVQDHVSRFRVPAVGDWGPTDRTRYVRRFEREHRLGDE